MNYLYNDDQFKEIMRLLDTEDLSNYELSLKLCDGMVKTGNYTSWEIKEAFDSYVSSKILGRHEFVCNCGEITYEDVSMMVSNTAYSTGDINIGTISFRQCLSCGTLQANMNNYNRIIRFTDSQIKRHLSMNLQ